MEAAVDVDDLAGGEREGARGEGRDRAARRRAGSPPAADRGSGPSAIRRSYCSRTGPVMSVAMMPGRTS